MKLIVGLGNPGKEYSSNRHNIGFLCVDRFAAENGIAIDNKYGKTVLGSGRIKGEEVVLAKPQTYMNASGQAVISLMQKYKVKLEDLIIVHDDMDLQLGKIRIRKDSSAGGHNGIKSIIEYLNTQNFVRLRVGIGRPHVTDEKKSHNIVQFVLGDFSKEDQSIVEEMHKVVNEALLCLITQGLDPAMNKFNQTPKTKKPKKSPESENSGITPQKPV